MSLLMEALRKAEEAKNKADSGDVKSDIDESSNSDESIDSNPEKISFESRPIIKKYKPEPSDDLEYFSNEAGTALLSTPDAQEESEKNEEIDDVILDPVSTVDINTELAESLSEPLEAPISDELPIEDYTDFLEQGKGLNSPLSEEHRQRNNQENENKQAINSLFQAKLATQQQKKRKYGIASAAILLLLVSAGGLYWYIDSSSYSSQYTIPTAYQTTERGILGEQAQLEPSEEVANPIVPLVASLVINEEPVEEQSLANESIANIANATEGQSTANTQEVAPTTPSNSLSPDVVAEPLQERNTISFTRTEVETRLNPQVSSAYSEFQNGNYDAAFSQYQDALETQQNDRNALLGLASIYTKRGNTVLAQGMYSRMLKLNPKDPLAQAGLLGSSLSADPLRQESELKSLVEQHPNVAPLSFALGNLYASQNRWNEAQNAYFDASVSAKTSDIGPISPDYAFNLAISLERLNQPKPAYNFYLEALELSRSAASGFEQELLLSRIQYLEQTLP